MTPGHLGRTSEWAVIWIWRTTMSLEFGNTPFVVDKDPANLALNLRKSALADGILQQVARVHRNRHDELLHHRADYCIHPFGAPTQKYDRFTFTKWATFLQGVFPLSIARPIACLVRIEGSETRPPVCPHPVPPSLAFRAEAINSVPFRCTALHVCVCVCVCVLCPRCTDSRSPIRPHFFTTRS